MVMTTALACMMIMLLYMQESVELQHASFVMSTSRALLVYQGTSAAEQVQIDHLGRVALLVSLPRGLVRFPSHALARADDRHRKPRVVPHRNEAQDFR